MSEFKLSEAFLDEYKNTKPDFGFNGLGAIVYYRTYSRLKEDGTNEVWWETVKRVVEGCFNMQKQWVETNRLHWNPWKAQKSAQEMYDRIFNFKFLPPGRGLWSQGSKIITERKLYEAQLNCAFTSTERLGEHGFDKTQPFCFLMDLSMKGVGVGFDVRGAENFNIQGPDEEKDERHYIIPDSREGWVESVRLLLEAYFEGKSSIEFDYSEIRPAGEPLKGFGGIAPGPQPLIDGHKEIRRVLDNQVDEPISEKTIVDLFNIIGKCVVSGGIRRTAEIAFGDPDSEEYLDLKDYDKNPDRENIGWVSNNSVFAELGMDYEPVIERIKNNGEPGFLWLENAQNYSRMVDPPDYKDTGVKGTNPCGEQPLEPSECCNLVETFPDYHDSVEDYKRTLKYAYMYAKTVTLYATEWPYTNRVMLKNRRIGLSMSGVAQFVERRGLHELKEWCEAGYEEIQRLDGVYSDWLAIPRSIKTTTVKPSGNTSLVAGVTPGMHYPESRFHIRRVRLSKNSSLIPKLEDCGYKIEPAFGSEDSTVVVEVPVDVGENVRSVHDVSVWEQLSLAAFLQKYWSDNAVSCTITFDPETETNQLKHALDYFQYQLKSVSFLPRHKGGAYKQMPYEAIDEDTYQEMLSNIEVVSFNDVEGEEADPEKFCDGQTCLIE